MEVFPADDFSADQILGWLQELLVAGLLQSYLVAGQRFLKVTGWKHQKIESPTFRFPQPESGTQFDDYSTISLRTLIDSSPPESSRVESKGVESKGVEDSNEAALRPSLQPDQVKFPTFGCTIGRRKGTDTWLLTDAFTGELQQTFPAVDVAAECREAWQWHKTNWAKRKTSDGMPDFLRRWMARAQNSGRGKAKPTPPLSRVPDIESERKTWTAHGGGE